MSEAPLYLIAHKVRGEPAFDIAQRIEIPGEGEGWIIPTSGHRAYPWWYQPLETNVGLLPTMPEGLPDHYQTRADPAPPRPAGLEAMLAAARAANAPRIDRRGL